MDLGERSKKDAEKKKRGRKGRMEGWDVLAYASKLKILVTSPKL